jgi:opacity protein-like surface antigen
MRRVQLVSILAIAASMVFGASLASAATFGAEVYGAFNTHSMGDWNDLIDQANASGADANNINNGITGGLDLRMWATPNWMFSAGWEPLFLSTKDEVSGDKISTNANSIQLTGSYFFPTAGKAKYGIGAGLGYYMIGGKVESATPGTPEADITGSAVGFHILSQGEFAISPNFNFTAGAGYRFANVGDTKIDDQSANPKFETDYSGFMARAGISFYMPQH